MLYIKLRSCSRKLLGVLLVMNYPSTPTANSGVLTMDTSSMPCFLSKSSSEISLEGVGQLEAAQIPRLRPVRASRSRLPKVRPCRNYR